MRTTTMEQSQRVDRVFSPPGICRALATISGKRGQNSEMKYSGPISTITHMAMLAMIRRNFSSFFMGMPPVPVDMGSACKGYANYCYNTLCSMLCQERWDYAGYFSFLRDRGYRREYARPAA